MDTTPSRPLSERLRALQGGGTPPPPTGALADRLARLRAAADQDAEHERRAALARDPERVTPGGAAVTAGMAALGLASGAGAGPLLTALRPDVAQGVGKALAVDLPLGLAHFATAPVRAVTAPLSPEEARNPLVRGAITARSGVAQDEGTAVHEALRNRGAGRQTPTDIVKETARGLVTMGYDLQRHAQGGALWETGEDGKPRLVENEPMSTEDKTRAVVGLGAMGLLTAHGGVVASRARAARPRPLEAAVGEALAPTQLPGGRGLEVEGPPTPAKPSAPARPPDALERLAADIRAEREGRAPPLDLSGIQRETPQGIVRLPTDAIVADPARFQFKQLGTEGVSAELKGVKTWNEQLAGIISVWRDPADGVMYVVNGHHRLELARRLGQPALNVQFIDAPTAEIARAEGAFINIAEGRGTATDVAKFVRDKGATIADFETRGISLRGELARDGVALSKLAPDIFDQVATAQIPQTWGVAIGHLLDDPVLQRETLAAVRGSGKRLNQAEVTEVARQVRDAGAEGVNQETLFGTETERRGLFVQRAQLAAAIKKRLAGDKRLFGFVAKEGRAEALSRAGGTTIDVEAARGLAEGSAQASEIFERLYTRSGPIAGIINEAARRMARGDKAAAVVADIYPGIGDAVRRELDAGGLAEGARPDGGERPLAPGTRSLADEIAGSEGTEPPRVADSQDPAQGGMFSPARRGRGTPDREQLTSLRAQLAREIERHGGDTSAPAVRNLQADIERLERATGGGRSYNATDLRSSIEAGVESAKRTGKEMFLYSTARGWRLIAQRPPTSGTFYRIGPDGHVVKSEPIMEGAGGRRETEVSTADVAPASGSTDVARPKPKPAPMDVRNAGADVYNRQLQKFYDSFRDQGPDAFYRAVQMAQRMRAGATLDEALAAEGLRKPAGIEAVMQRLVELEVGVEEAGRAAGIEPWREVKAREYAAWYDDVLSGRKPPQTPAPAPYIHPDYWEAASEAKTRFKPGESVVVDGEAATVDTQVAGTRDLRVMLNKDPNGLIVHRVDPLRVEYAEGGVRADRPKMATSEPSPAREIRQTESAGDRGVHRATDAEWPAANQFKPGETRPLVTTDGDYVLYHGTTREAVGGIEARGLLGDNIGRAGVTTHPADAGMMGSIKAGRGKRAIVEMVIDGKWLMAQRVSREGDHPGMWLVGRGRSGEPVVPREAIKSVTAFETWEDAVKARPEAARSEVLELRGEPTGPDQSSMFGERAGTAASRSLAQTEAAARAELETLRERHRLEQDPAKRARLAADIAQREKLVNRDRALSAEELRTEAEARGTADAPVTGPDQMAFFSPAATPEYQAKLTAAGAAPSADVMTLMQISRKLAEAVGVPLRQGRFRAAARRALGVFFPHAEVTRVQRFDMLGTAAHEVAHYISKKYLRWPTRRGAAKRGAPLLPRQAMRELVQMGRDLYGDRKPAAGYGEEGIAEWGKFYVTDPAHLQQAAPTFTAWMEGVLAQEPLLRAAFDQARERFVAHQQAPATARVDAMTSVGERENLVVTMRDYMRVVADDTYDVRAAVQELGGAPNPSRDAGILARLARGTWSEAAEWLERGVRQVGEADTRMNGGVGETFGPILRAGRAQALRRYLIGESALERWERGINPGITQAEAQAMVDLYKGDKQIVAAAQAAWDHSLALLRARHDAGILSDRAFEAISKANQRRVGFYRVFEADETAAPRGGGKGGLGSSGVKGQKGSARQIIDPIESIIRDTYLTAKKIRQEHATRALIELSELREGGGKVVEEVPAPQRPVQINAERLKSQLAEMGLVYEGVDAKTGQKFTASVWEAEIEGLLRSFEDARVAGAAEAKDLVVPVLRNGELRWYQIKDKPLYDALVGMGPIEYGLWRRVLSFPKRLLQVGATTTLEFGFGNIARDIVGQSVFSRAPWRPPLWRHMEGLYHVLRKDPVYQRFRLHGADQATMGGVDRGNLQLNARRLFGYFRTAKQAWLDRGSAWSRASSLEKARMLGTDVERVVLSPFEAIRAVKEMSETMGRVGEFAAVERQALKRGASPIDASTEAALGARDVGIDFQQLGTGTRAVNDGVAFFGAFMRGWAQLGRELKARPHVVIPRLVALVTVPSLVLYYTQRDDPFYRDMAAWKRDLFWIYVQRGDDQGEGWDGYGSGKVEHVWMFPKPFELGILFGTLPERAAEWADRKNPEPGRSVAEALRRAVTPPHWPAVATPLVENFANRSSFRDRPIVPRNRENLEPAEQFAPHTGETARAVGRAANVSPAKLENLVRGYTGGAGMYVLRGTDVAVRKARETMGLPPLKQDAPEAEDPLTEVPGLRRFVSRAPAEDAESVARLYRRYEDAERKRLTWRKLLAEGRAGEARTFFAKHREEITSVATREESGGQPGPLRAAHEQLAHLQDARRQLQAGGAMTPEQRRRLADIGRRLSAGVP